ncbi:hypothetical protein GXW71_28540 [Roseomonas hellenica]|uniref:Uncharacterized protein n=1 Tax=Plastoroseomonas hellenica TaxID=2687306 RepID=A0ABS5F6Z5_9PROT|nr:hypothetical protein [Plastoroseomonas hellenica]MBR0668335.1 hypothetical protein [Plastoroseomonas hellenica]
MIGLGALFLVGAASVAGIFGLGMSFGTFLYRLVPGFVPWLQSLVQRHGWTNAWSDVGVPLMDAPAWLPPLLIGLVLILLGWARRRA